MDHVVPIALQLAQQLDDHQVQHLEWFLEVALRFDVEDQTEQLIQSDHLVLEALVLHHQREVQLPHIITIQAIFLHIILKLAL